MEKNKGGRPPQYKSVVEMQVMIDKYFEECKGHTVEDKEGNVLTDKNGIPILIDVKPLTITGLALALGFNSRQALLNYEGKAEFNDTIRKAKAKVEEYAEARLFDRDGSNGAKFALANNFKGWAEKQTIEADVKNEVTISVELVEDED